MTKLDFLPVILGSDDNAYGISRAFYEEYGIKSIVVTKGDILPTMHSKIIEKFYVNNLDNPNDFADNLLELWPKFSKMANKLILIGCNENYVELCIRNSEKLEGKYILPFIKEKQMDEIIYKENFYKICEQHGLDYPDTVIFKKGMDPNMDLPFNFPVVVKPSDSVTYFNAQFEGKEKAYILKDKESFVNVIQLIYSSSYQDSLIIQDYIPGGDDTMRVLNAYVDQNHKVRMMTLGRVVLEDCTPILLGNYVAIVPEYNEEIYNVYSKFLEDIEFTGFANIDLKYDARDGKYKIFELNIRQGRSSYFVTASGYNLAKYLVDDRVYNQQKSPVYGNGDVLWHSVPIKIVKNYVQDPDLKKEVLRLIKEKKTANTLYYNKDMNLIRKLKLYNYYRDYHRRFKLYFKTEDN